MFKKLNFTIFVSLCSYVERNIFKEFTARIFSTISTHGMVTAGGGGNPVGSTTGSVPLAAALIDHHSRTSSKSEFFFVN